MPIVVSSEILAAGDSISDYESLKSAVLSWTHRASTSDVATLIPTFIQLGEARIYRDLRIRQMETAFSTAISSGVIATPTGYVELKWAYVDGTPATKLQRKDAEWIYWNYPTRAADGKPQYIAREGTNLIFGPYPDSAYTIKGVYYKKLDALSASNTSNWLITDAPDLILFAALCEAAPWMQDDTRVSLWEQKYQQIKERIERQDRQEEFSGGPLQVVSR